MLRILSWIVGIPVAAAIVAFAVANRGSVKLSLLPLPFEIELPLYLVALGAMLAGLILGGLIAWLSAGRLRRRTRQAVREAEAASREARALREKIERLETETPAKRANLPAPLDAA